MRREPFASVLDRKGDVPSLPGQGPMPALESASQVVRESLLIEHA
jgi:hypothetical protein